MKRLYLLVLIFMCSSMSFAISRSARVTIEPKSGRNGFYGYINVNYGIAYTYKTVICAVAFDRKKAVLTDYRYNGENYPISSYPEIFREVKMDWVFSIAAELYEGNHKLGTVNLNNLSGFVGAGAFGDQEAIIKQLGLEDTDYKNSFESLIFKNLKSYSIDIGKYNNEFAKLAIKEEYNQLIQIADNLFQQQNWDEALSYYNRAIRISGFSSESHPNSRIKDINEILKKNEDEKNKKEAEELAEKEKAKLEEDKLASIEKEKANYVSNFKQNQENAIIQKKQEKKRQKEELAKIRTAHKESMDRLTDEMAVATMQATQAIYDLGVGIGVSFQPNEECKPCLAGLTLGLINPELSFLATIATSITSKEGFNTGDIYGRQVSFQLNFGVNFFESILIQPSIGFSISKLSRYVKTGQYSETKLYTDNFFSPTFGFMGGGGDDGIIYYVGYDTATRAPVFSFGLQKNL